MKKLKKILSFAVIVLTYTAVNAQSNDTLFYRHSIQSNIAGLGFERCGIAYELRITPRHALFVQGGGSFPFISEEKEYGFGLHYKYFVKPVSEPKFLWLFKSAYNNNIDINIPGEDSGKNGYGYTWWTSVLSHNGEKINMYRAGGWGGQEIMVFPSLDMVVVFTGGNYADKTRLYEVVERYILPAVPFFP